MATHYVGLDVHWKHTTVCILDGHGKRVKRLTIRGAWSKIADKPKQLLGKVSVCFEASTAYGYLHEMLSKIAEHVVVAHPGQLRFIFRSMKRNDWVDAEKLAKPLFLGEVLGFMCLQRTCSPGDNRWNINIHDGGVVNRSLM